VLVLVLAVGACGLDGVPAEARTDHFCVSIFLGAGADCAQSNNQIDHWDRVRNRYLGNETDNVTGCVYMVNLSGGGSLRGGIIPCARTWTRPSSNPMGHNYGVTTEPNYGSRIRNGSCCGHSFTGWASDNQTDG